MTENEVQRQIADWRRAEDRFYGSVLTMPELYTTGIRLVRAVADRLQDATDVDALLEVYYEMGVDEVIEVAEALELSHRDFLDYELARDAAFYLRYQEVQQEQARTEMAQRVAEAREADREWVVLYDDEIERGGSTFFRRLEMHVPDGVGLYTALELDWEKGRVYVVEPIMLDSETGEPRPGEPPPDPRQEFATREEWAAAVATLREKYSGSG